MSSTKPLTLRDCTVPIPLRCMHCDREFGPASPIEAYDQYVAVECLKCHLCTVFKLEKSA